MKRLPYILIFFLGCLVATKGRAQVQADTTAAEPSIVKSPRTAVIRSALIPGWGQWYNEKRIKAIIVFGGEAVLVGTAIGYHRLASKSETDIERDFYLDNKSKFIWYFVAAHLLNMLDAYIDAHLWDFDTGPDLSSVHPGEEAVLLFGIRLKW